MMKSNGKNLPLDRVNELLRMAGSDPKLQNSLRQGNINEVLGSLPPQDAQMVRGILNDPARLKQVLASPEAQQLMKQLKIKQ